MFSDYRFRGVSLSDRDVALQGTVTATHNPTGIYAGFWSSTIEQLNGAEAELDLYAGWAKELGPVKLDVGATGYVYPGGDDVNYFELYAKAGHEFGPLSTTLSFTMFQTRRIRRKTITTSVSAVRSAFHRRR
ncbi:hypothetical protein E6W36_10405 [Hankyongella ginsenosidimutans]|uniref:Porin n=1 Tax=Hankyongella ginsenosidimutans TaxID=1763828 RepID=A0A4D7C4B0_9SPHN|nr:hypothetical protein E6W36_10405 [Hankyongella ginsenosidimutans]